MKWTITDAHHDSIANVYYTMVPVSPESMIYIRHTDFYIVLHIHAHVYSTCKIVGVSTISRTHHTIAKTKELACTKEVLPNVIGKGIVTLTYIVSIILVTVYTFLSVTF